MNQQLKLSGEDAAWLALVQPASDGDFFSSWLALQCGAIAGCTGGWAWACESSAHIDLIAAQPSERAPPGGMLALAREALQRRDGVLEDAGRQDTWLLAYPLIDRGRPLGVVAVEVGAASLSELKPAMRQLQWGSGWYLARRRESAQTSVATSRPSQVALELFMMMLEAESFPAAAMSLAVEAAFKLGLDRASVGVCRWRRTDVVAVSNAPLADQRMAVMRRIEAAMDEAVDQRAVILVPPFAEDRGFVTRANEALVAGDTMAAAATFPLMAGGEPIGALVLERAVPFTPEEVAVLEAIAALAGPILDEKRRNNRWITTRVALGAGSLATSLVGAGYPRLKLAGLALVAAALASVLMHPVYEISAPAMIEAEAKRVVLAPYDAYLASADARPGDMVKAGDVLGRLDDSDLKLEKMALTADRDQKDSELQAATAKYDLAKANVLRAETEQIKAKLRLVEVRLARAVLTAPIDGLVLTGDLSQSIGEPIKTGAPMFELAPTGSFRLVVNVDEGDIEAAEAGQKGRAVLAALPEQTLNFEVKRLGAVVESKGGRNFYRVEGKLLDLPAALRPGFEGRARIGAGQRPLWWIATHRIVTWLRLQFWTWAP